MFAVCGIMHRRSCLLVTAGSFLGALLTDSDSNCSVCGSFSLMADYALGSGLHGWGSITGGEPV